MSQNKIIKAKNLLKKYETLEVLNVSELEIESQILNTIVGPSGAGKSTLLHILGTLLKPTEGEIWIGENNLSTLNDKNLAKFRNKNLGFVFQNHNLLPELTAIENVCLPAIIGNISAEKYMESAQKWLKILGLENRTKHYPSQLSGGEQQRVSVARALINNPLIILADEPSGNLDTKNAEMLHDLFLQLKEEYDYTFLIVTHNQSLAKKSQRVIEMKDGRMV